MRALVSFALGLWTGGLVVGLLWAFYFRAQVDRPETAAVMPESRPAIVSSEELRQLRQDNAVLGAEITRLRESLQELQTVTRPTPERRQVARPEPLTAAANEVAPGQPITLTDLERLARDNDPAALETLLGTAGDGQQSILRLWRSAQLSDANRALIARYLSGLAESLLAELDPGSESMEPVTE